MPPITRKGKEQKPRRISHYSNISPNMQGEDNMNNDGTDMYTFKNNHAEEDIKNTLEEISPEKNCYIVSNIQSKPGRDDYFCTVRPKDPSKRFIWPTLNAVQRDVIRDLKKLTG